MDLWSCIHTTLFYADYGLVPGEYFPGRSCRGKVVWFHNQEKPKDLYTVGIELKNIDKQTQDTLKNVAKTLRKISDEILEEDEF